MSFLAHPIIASRQRKKRSGVGRTTLRVGGALLIISGLALYAADAQSGAATTDGAASLVVDNNAGTQAITTGLSDTPFGLALSSSPAADGTVNNRPNCSADSATGSTYVYTYLIPATDSVTTDNFATGEPGVLASGDKALALFTTGGIIETDSTTQQTAPRTGQVTLPPTMGYAFGQITNPTGGNEPVSTLTGTNNGQWVGGVACVKNGSTVTDYWQFHVSFTSSATGPNNSQGFSWTVAPDVGVGSTTTTTAAPVDTTSTTAASTDTTTTVAASTLTSSSTTSGGATAAGSEAGGGSAAGGGGSAAGQSSSGSSAQLAATGSPVRREASVALLLLIAGVTTIMASILLGGRRPGTHYAP